MTIAVLSRRSTLKLVQADVSDTYRVHAMVSSFFRVFLFIRIRERIIGYRAMRNVL